LGLGLLGLTPALLYDLTFREFANAVRGRYADREQQQQSAWERTRWQTALLLNVHTKKGSNLRPRDLVQFPWEKVEKQNNPHAGFAQLVALAKKKQQKDEHTRGTGS
tara:strand:+ start:2017 stop:2337 length:321 start_codon:yes stop_codon:yes gene_type:complete